MIDEKAPLPGVGARVHIIENDRAKRRRMSMRDPGKQRGGLLPRLGIQATKASRLPFFGLRSRATEPTQRNTGSAGSTAIAVKRCNRHSRSPSRALPTGGTAGFVGAVTSYPIER